MSADDAGKLSKSVAMYYSPASIGAAAGANCAACYKFIRGGRCCEVEGAIDGPTGICGLYVHGTPRDSEPPFQLVKISQQEASYARVGPTHCANCQYFRDKRQPVSLCAKVEGLVAAEGCCNFFEKSEAA